MLLNGLPDSCQGCSLSTNPHPGYFTKIEGKGHSGVLIVGEASGEGEANSGLPFRPEAPAGSILEKVIRMSGMTRDDFLITNILRCRPPNNILAGAPYESEAISHCSGNLNKVISEYNPRAILALGSIPLRELTGRSGGKSSISYLRGYCLPGPNGIPTISSFHPAFIARGNTRLIGLLIKDLASARSAASGRLTYVVDPSTEIQCYEGVKALEKLYLEAKEDPEVWIAYDIETPQSIKGAEDELIEFQSDTDSGANPNGHEGDASEMGQGEERPYTSGSSNEGGDSNIDKLDLSSTDITSIQFAISDRWGVYGDWTDPRIRTLAQDILSLPNPKVAHNGDHFDRPRLEREGIRIVGDHFDSLSMRKALQPDLPAGLQQVAVDYGWRWPWKHYSGSNAILYGVADVCSLVRIVSKLPDELDRLGMWDGYQKYVREFREKVEVPWERRGIPMSISRLNDLRNWLTIEAQAKIDEVHSLIPDELNGRHPKEGYKDIPDKVKELVMAQPDVQELFKPTIRQLKNGKIKEVKSKRKISDVYKMMVEEEAYELLGLVYSTYPDIHLGEFNGHRRLYQSIPFNPRSSIQMIKYLKFKGYEVPKTFKEGKETTSDKLMKRLEKITNDPVIALSREIRALEKMKDSYTGKIDDSGIARGGWIPSSDGRLHPRILTKSTWQMASVNPNVMTMPVRRGELADRFRRCVKAEDGHTLLEIDFKSFHAKMTGREAKDLSYMRLSSLDIHSYVTGFMVKWPKIETVLSLPDVDLQQFLSQIRAKHKEVRNLQAKPAILGIGFGMSSRRLFFENEEYFRDEKEAKRLLDLIKKIFPKVFQWQNDLLEEVDKKRYIQSNWGARRWFWDTFSWKKNREGRWYRAKGADAEKAIAYLPSNHSHGMLRKKLLDLESLGLLEKYELVNVVHDALLFHVPDTLLEEATYMIKSILEYPVIELADMDVCPDGFVCEVEVSSGPDWAKGSMKEII